MPSVNSPEHLDTVIIGGGQSGLSVAYHLKRLGIPFIVLESNAHVGDSWRHRWDSLRLFTPARYDGLVGMRFPAPPFSFPSKDDMAAYLARYAARFELPVRTGVRVDHVTRDGTGYLVSAGEERFEARNVVVAMASYQTPKIPAFAAELAPDIVQLHSSEYRNPASCARAVHSSSGPATRERRSRSSSRTTATPRGSPDETRDIFPTRSTDSSRA